MGVNNDYIISTRFIVNRWYQNLSNFVR